MILFDYVYYIFANLYRLAKGERQADAWRGSGIIVSSGCHCMFIMALVIFFTKGTDYTLLINTYSVLILFIIVFVFFIIRYNKITDYNKIERRLKDLSKIKQLILNIITIIYLLIAIPGWFILIFTAGPLVGD